MNFCAVVSGVLGACGALAFIAVYFHLPDIRNVARRRLLSLSLVQLLQGALLAVQGVVDTQDEFWCWATGPLLTYCTMSSALWTTCISFYVGLVIRNQRQATHRIFARFRLLSWGYPTLWLAAVVGRHVYTYGVLSYNSVGSGDCFESPTFDPLDKPLYWAGYAVPLAVCMWVTSHRYLEARLQMQVLQKVHNEHAAEYGESAMKYALIPTFFVISRSWIYVEAIVALYDPAWVPMCSCLRVAGVAGQGLTDAAVFVLLTHKIRAHVFSPPKEEEDSYAMLSDRAATTLFG